MGSPQLQARLFFNALQRPERNVALRMGDRHAALFGGMLELNVAALLSHLDPAIPLKGRDNFPAIHGVYLYTLKRWASTVLTPPGARRSPHGRRAGRRSRQRGAPSASDTFHARSRISARCGNRSALDRPARRA